MDKAEEALRKIHTVSYFYQTDEINHDELEAKLLNILDEYAQQVSREVAWKAWWEASMGSDIENEKKLFDEWQKQK